MKNKTITIYELLGLIKDGKAPKEIKFDNRVYKFEEEINNYLMITKGNSTKRLGEYDLIYCIDVIVEILDETDDEFEDIEELEIKTSANNNYIVDEYGTNCYLTKNSKIIIENQNKIIRNQKKIIAKLEELNNE